MRRWHDHAHILTHECRWHEGIQLLHCEGYCLYRPQLAKQMTQMAKERGAKVSMDLASFEVCPVCVRVCVCVCERGGGVEGS